MDVRVLTGLVCPAARPLGVRQYPGALKGCGVKMQAKTNISDSPRWNNIIFVDGATKPIKRNWRLSSIIFLYNSIVSKPVSLF